MIPTFNHPLGIPYARKLQYIASTGTQYINTGIKPDFPGGDKIEIHSDNPSGGSTFGSRQYTTTYVNSIYQINSYIVMYANGPGSSMQWNDHVGDHVLRIDDSNIVDNGTILTATPYRVTIALDIFLFTFNEGGQPHSSYASGMKLYEWAFWRNGTLAQHLVPVLDKSGVPCLYDTVTRTLKYNAGSGTFNYA